MESQVITGENIERFRLLALKGALKLEVAGMRHSKMGSVAKIVKQMLAEAGIKGKARKAELLAQFEAYIASL